MFTCMWLFGIVLFSAAGPAIRAQPAPHPTSCEEFERGARFDPYLVIDAMWKIFYFWSNTTEVYPIMFSLPSKKRISKFKAVVDIIDPDLGVEWERSTLLMEPRPGIQVLFLYLGTPGAFRALVKKEQRDKARPYPEPLIKFADVRMKLVGRYIGMMCCEDYTAFAIARMDEMPLTEAECKKAADMIGYKGIEGRSYLYLMKSQREEEL